MKRRVLSAVLVVSLVLFAGQVNAAKKGQKPSSTSKKVEVSTTKGKPQSDSSKKMTQPATPAVPAPKVVVQQAAKPSVGAPPKVMVQEPKKSFAAPAEVRAVIEKGRTTAVTDAATMVSVKEAVRVVPQEVPLEKAEPVSVDEKPVMERGFGPRPFERPVEALKGVVSSSEAVASQPTDVATEKVTGSSGQQERAMERKQERFADMKAEPPAGDKRQGIGFGPRPQPGRPEFPAGKPGKPMKMIGSQQAQPVQPQATTVAPVAQEATIEQKVVSEPAVTSESRVVTEPAAVVEDVTALAATA